MVFERKGPLRNLESEAGSLFILTFHLLPFLGSAPFSSLPFPSQHVVPSPSDSPYSVLLLLLSTSFPRLESSSIGSFSPSSFPSFTSFLLLLPLAPPLLPLPLHQPFNHHFLPSLLLHHSYTLHSWPKEPEEQASTRMGSGEDWQEKAQDSQGSGC